MKLQKLANMDPDRTSGLQRPA